MYLDQARMAGELSFLIILEAEGDMEVEAEAVVDALAVLIWSAMSVVSLVILLENAACVVVQEDVAVAAAALDIVGAQAMDAGKASKANIVFMIIEVFRLLNITYQFEAEVTVLVDDPQDVAVSLLVGVATASLPHTVVVRNCHMLMGEVPWTLYL